MTSATETVLCFFLLFPEVWQQPVEAGVHSGPAGGLAGLGFQGQVQQEARD